MDCGCHKERGTGYKSRIEVLSSGTSRSVPARPAAYQDDLNLKKS